MVPKCRPNQSPLQPVARGNRLEPGDIAIPVIDPALGIRGRTGHGLDAGDFAPVKAAGNVFVEIESAQQPVNRRAEMKEFANHT